MGLEIAIAVEGQVDAELAEATTVEVDERMGEPTTYHLSYPVDISEDDLPLLVDSRLNPGSELAILATTDQGTVCLVKGPVHSQQIHLQHGGAGSTVVVTGVDTSLAMDRESRIVQWADVADSDAVSSIVATYGYTPDVETTDAGHFTDKHTLIQRDSDLRFVKRLARRNGFLFWITCDETGIETAHFKRPSLDGDTTAELIINLASPNLDNLDISWDVERPTSVIGVQLDLNSLTTMDGSVAVSPQTILGNQGLAAITGDTRSVHLLAPADDTGDLQARGRGLLIDADWFIQATCETTLHALGRLVRAHTLVNLRGAGSRYSGIYFVAAARHRIDATAHRIALTLVRNGWLA
ncbi:MAG: hypothetical protein JXA33_12510 [Anaerolineae bacterium]|nr:hypothetical protein [Anaerolineae bacterium]